MNARQGRIGAPDGSSNTGRAEEVVEAGYRSTAGTLPGARTSPARD
ncbi:hypothetical protein [Neoroseomonas soli]|uniref:Uncharacterized protein n=1 Tax=Neoroseomonas soli TaxID=1081025 RepID=A0A9X9X4E7_9PROT|nr:hypothetical protein [Neoroseomonas soli]MBR0674276.1 hypothetical protein [Neoroseomonas soli]